MEIDKIKEELKKLYSQINECNCPEVAVALLKKAGILEHKIQAQDKRNKQESGVTHIGQNSNNVFKGQN